MRKINEFSILDENSEGKRAIRIYMLKREDTINMDLK